MPISVGKKNSDVIVIGAGFSGLSCACHLAKSGYSVTVLEKNDQTGGRARVMHDEGFTWDMGPSWYWMPDVFERFFNSFNKTVADFYELERLDPSYKVIYKNDELLIPAKMAALEELFESIEPGSAAGLKKFLQQASFKYDVGVKRLVYKPSRSITEFVDLDLLKGLIKMDVFTSMRKHVRKFFKNEKLVQLVEFPVLFLGATAANTPALYSLMNYADMALGTWYPKGGMGKIAEGMTALAKELGVNFHLNEEVTSFEFESNQIAKVRTKNSVFTTDSVVASADYHHIDQKVLPTEFRNYSATYWDKRTMAPSSLLFYLGVNKKIPKLLHHNLFFDEDFDQHAHEIYEDPKWPSKPLTYVSVTSKTDKSVAPENMENVFMLIPVAPGIEDDHQTREKYYDITISKLEKYVGENIRDHVVVKKSYAHKDFQADYHSFKGNAYGLANTLRQTAILKPSLKSKKVKNLFYTGQLTVPGPGVPPSLISGEVVAGQVAKEFPIR